MSDSKESGKGHSEAMEKEIISTEMEDKHIGKRKRDEFYGEERHRKEDCYIEES